MSFIRLSIFDTKDEFTVMNLDGIIVRWQQDDLGEVRSICSFC